jgi:hypothetical protein
MKNIVLVLLVLFLVFPAYSNAEDFLGAPVIPEGEVIKKSNARLELKTKLSHYEVLGFYKEALKEAQDIKFREWKEATYIEDDRKLVWHSITISKGDKSQETIVVIAKDN